MEAFGQVFVEAMASGTPIISSDTVGARELVTEDIGLIVPQEDWKALARKSLMLLNDLSLYKEKSIAARKKFDTSFDWDRIIIPKYLLLYKELLSPNA